MPLCQRCVSCIQLTFPHYHQLICLRSMSKLNGSAVFGVQRMAWLVTRTLTLYRNMSAVKASNGSTKPGSQMNVQQRINSVYIWGNGKTGALGIRKLYGNAQAYPCRLVLKDDEMPISLSLGYGFSVLVTHNQRSSQVYGWGLNTSGQLAVPLDPHDPDHLTNIVTEPAVININWNPEHNDANECSHIIDISCGKAHTWIVTDNNRIFSFGNNAYGQCGKPVNKDKMARPDDGFVFPEKIKQVCCGLDHTLVLSEEGNVYSCGLGADGQTGLGHYEAVDTLTQVCGDIKGEKIVSLSSKADTVLALSENGEVFGWGNSEYGQFSAVIGEEMQVNVPRHLSFLQNKKVRQVAAAGTMCGILDDVGNVYTWGYGFLGKHGMVEQIDTPQLINECSSGAEQSSEQFLPVQLSCGLTHFAAVTETGHLYMWGKQRHNCLGPNQEGHASENVSKPTKVDIPAHVQCVLCGIDHSAALCMTKI